MWKTDSPKRSQHLIQRIVRAWCESWAPGEDDTRAALEPFADDERVRFLDFPKGARHGELNRHEALREARGRIVCYLSDDDLRVMIRALEKESWTVPVVSTTLKDRLPATVPG